MVRIGPRAGGPSNPLVPSSAREPGAAASENRPAATRPSSPDRSGQRSANATTHSNPIRMQHSSTTARVITERSGVRPSVNKRRDRHGFGECGSVAGSTQRGGSAIGRWPRQPEL